MKLVYTLDDSWTSTPVSVALIGAGGTGSDMAVRLAKLHRQIVALGGAGLDVTVYDGDTVSPTNIGRQHFSPSAIGLNKAIALVQSLNLAYAMNWKAVPRMLSPIDADADHGIDDDGPPKERSVDSYNLLVTCVDKAVFRAELGSLYSGERCSTLWLDTGNGRDCGQVVLGHLGKPYSGLRLPNVADLYPNLSAMVQADVEEPSCSAAEAMLRQAWPVNQMAAMLGVEMLWTLIRTGKLDYHGASFTLAPVTTTPMWIDTDAWAFFGYEPEAAEEEDD